MKFAKKLKSNITPEWHDQYIDYENLKILIDQLNADKYDDLITESNLCLNQVSQFTEIFIQNLDKEVSKVNNFYLERKNDNKEILDDIADKLRQHQANVKSRQQAKEAKIWSLFSSKKMNIESNLKEKSKSGRKFSLAHLNMTRKSLMPTTSKFFVDSFNKMAKNGLNFNQKTHQQNFEKLLSEFYLNLHILQHYQKINLLACFKIIKKFDKNFGTELLSTYFYPNIKHAQNFTTKKFKTTKKMIQQVEIIATEFYQGDKKIAMEKIRVNQWMFEDKECVGSSSLISLGILYGLILGSLVFIILNLINFYPKSRDKTDQLYASFRIFRPGFYFTFYLYLIAINFHIFIKTGVNFIGKCWHGM